MSGETTLTVYYSAESNSQAPSLSDFEHIKVIGRGTFGKVVLVKQKDTGQAFAMKILRKDIILDADVLESTLLEKEILLKAEHPFLMGMYYMFQNDQKIFFVMRFSRGGELFSHLSAEGRFSEERARFYSIQIALAFGYLH